MSDHLRDEDASWDYDGAESEPDPPPVQGPFSPQQWLELGQRMADIAMKNIHYNDWPDGRDEPWRIDFVYGCARAAAHGVMVTLGRDSACHCFYGAEPVSCEPQKPTAEEEFARGQARLAAFKATPRMRQIDEAIERQLAEIAERRRKYREAHPQYALSGRVKP